ncbi:MAG: enolase C-terminal domain-like protein, partial [Ignavibacteria bacterium]|nr:enolase C-terminal domain-like protein [Ignavibacteria bacterium]
FEKLNRLAEFEIHSIEQPVKQGQIELMADVCKKSPIPIALDEELIGVYGVDNRKNLLQLIKPQYIILKPSLLGGFQQSDEWIDLSDQNDVGWWITSALESNIGLNAIAQWTAEKTISMPQGLGTGQLFTNNFDSPLVLRNGRLAYDPKLSWNLENLFR